MPEPTDTPTPPELWWSEMDQRLWMAAKNPGADDHWYPVGALGEVRLGLPDDVVLLVPEGSHDGDTCAEIDAQLDKVTGDYNEITYWIARLGGNPRGADGKWDVPLALRDMVGELSDLRAQRAAVLAHLDCADSGGNLDASWIRELLGADDD